jgi:OmpA-OmpF porin, OOP family
MTAATKATLAVLADENWNQGLSERRAQAIREYLINRGVDGRRIVRQGNGSSKPLANNKTAEGRARNRCTEILFVAGKG